MPTRLLTGFALAVALLAVGGCSAITNPARLAVFDWGEVEDPTSVVDGIDPAVALGEVFILGQVSTPTRCYRLNAEFDESGSEIRLHVRGEMANPDCADDDGGYRYTATIRNLAVGLYDLRVTHEVVGGETQTFTDMVDVR